MSLTNCHRKQGRVAKIQLELDKSFLNPEAHSLQRLQDTLTRGEECRLGIGINFGHGRGEDDQPGVHLVLPPVNSVGQCERDLAGASGATAEEADWTHHSVALREGLTVVHGSTEAHVETVRLVFSSPVVLRHPQLEAMLSGVDLASP
jgi:hypothetical protein